MSDIVGVLEHYGAHVPRSLRWAKMRCPFHDDRHPSATVSTELGRFVCFACGINESAAGLIKLREGGSYADALKRAKEITGEGSDELPGFDYAGDFLPVRARGGFQYRNDVGSWRGRVA